MGNDPQKCDPGYLMESTRQLRNRPATAAFLAALFLSTALVCAGQTSAQLESAESILRSGSVEEKREALYQLRVIGTAEAARPAVYALGDLSPTVRAEAASTCAYLSPDTAAASLVPLLDDKQTFVRKETALALGRSRAKGAVQGLLRVFEKDRKQEVRAAAATALGLIGDPAAVPALTRSFSKNRGSSKAFLRREAAGAIGRIAQSVRTGIVTDSIPESFLPSKFKTSLAIGAGDLTESDPVFRQAAKSLSALLSNPKEGGEVRRNAAFALGAIGYEAARIELSSCAVSDDTILSETCKEAVSKLGPGL